MTLIPDLLSGVVLFQCEQRVCCPGVSGWGGLLDLPLLFSSVLAGFSWLVGGLVTAAYQQAGVWQQ